MYYEDNRVKDLKVAYIGGGSRGWAWGFMMDLAADAQMEGTVALYDIDHEAAEHNEIIGNKISAHPDAVSHWKYTVADTLQQALTGADFVVISILPGTFDEMESDVHAPEAYGIYQSVGDTVGAGGFMRAMRTIPMYVTIAEAIRDYSPNAWVINYTNPMTLCVRTLYHVFPKIKAFGCCHEVFGTQTLLTHILDEELGLKDVARQDIKVNVKGINHFTWFDKATYKGMDLFPIYRKFAEEHYESGYEYGDTNWMNSSFACANRVKFDLFLRYGCIAAAGDRHLAEFMPGKTYLESPEAVREWKFGLTTVAWRKNELQERLARSRRLRTGEEPIEIKPDGEEGHLLMKALLGLGDLVSNVNIPNHGAIANLPWDAVVEVNALFSRQGVQSVNAGPLPANILPLVARHVYNQENTLTAALTCDRTLGLTTFMNDPHAAGWVADGTAGGQPDGPADDVTSQHAQAFGLFHRQKAAANHDVGPAFQLFQHGGDIFRSVLAVSIQLHGAVIPVFGGIAQPGLECTCQPQVDRQIDQAEPMFPADGRGFITAAIVDYNIVILRVVLDNAVDDLDNIGFLIICRNNNQQF